MPDEHAFPQDWATGLQETVDWNDAGSFANLADHPNNRSYVAEGLTFDVDWANDIFQLAEGRAYLHQSTTGTNDHREDNGPDEKELEGGLFVGQRGPSGDLTLTADATNHVFMGIDQSENDLVEYHVNTTDTAPPAPYLKLGTIDTANDTYVELNRAPTVTTRRLRVTGDTHGADY